MSENILSVVDLNTSFRTDRGEVMAVNGVSFNLDRGKILGIVGESGSGKSVTAYSIMQILEKNGSIKKGQVLYKGQDITKFSEKQMREFRGKCCSIIFQDPMTSLNPVFTIGNQLKEAIELHTDRKGKVAMDRAIEMLTLVGVNEPEKRVKQYPYELSGGMRQRVMIAMALACQPQILIADEPTTALDVTIQAQILDLIRDLNQEMNTSVVFITHDLGVVSELCDTVIVMYNGHIVEKAPTADIFREPLHPYTQGLLSAIPRITKERKPLSTIEGMVPNPVERIKGCRFWPRCPKACDRCRKEEPPVFSVGEDRQVRCWLYAQADNGSQEAVTNG